METRKPYPTDVSDEDRAFVAPYLTLLTPDVTQRDHKLREVFNDLRWIVWALPDACCRMSSRPGMGSTIRSNAG